MKEWFHKIASRVSSAVGSPFASVAAFSTILIWAATGPLFSYSDTWQLVINTATTVVTFLMVFLIQNTQNRDAKAMQLKLDELIRSNRSARDSFIDLEDITDDELHALEADFRVLHEKYEASRLAGELHERIQKERSRRSV